MTRGVFMVAVEKSPSAVFFTDSVAQRGSFMATLTVPLWEDQ